jgi:hypothetical protein
MATTTALEPVEQAAINIRSIGTERILVPITGTAPLIVHAWSQKAKQQMLDAQQGRKNVKVIRDPQADYESSLYRLEGERFGFPTLAFKAATVGAGRYFGKDTPMTRLRQSIFMRGEPSVDASMILTRIIGDPRMREDMVRVGMGGTDLRYRGEFIAWTAVLDVTYVTSALSRDSVLALIDAGGMGCGVGEWRPEKSGQNGTYTVDGDIEVVK